MLHDFFVYSALGINFILSVYNLSNRSKNQPIALQVEAPLAKASVVPVAKVPVLAKQAVRSEQTKVNVAATGNCVPCCDLCNYMKRSMSLDDFLVHIKKIAAHSQENLNGF